MAETAGAAVFASHTLEYLQMSPEEAGTVDRVIGHVWQERPLHQLLGRLEAKGETETVQQSGRVAVAAVTIGDRLGQADLYLHMLARAAFSHDVGKSEDAVLEQVRSGQRFADNDQARAVISRHPALGAELILASRWRKLVKRAVAVMTHGSHMFQQRPYGEAPAGYTLCAEIVAFADQFDAFASDRTWRQALAASEMRAALEAEHVGPYKDALLHVCFEGGRFRMPNLG